jgi:adenosyl cobinamide kinase/adenosyl cobinamide phosphate guanylyltransferase/predicted nucleic acid-binding Zn ribbon protein
MKHCNHCGSSFEGRTNKKYCSDSCKVKASQNRKKHTQLSDSASLVLKAQATPYQVANIPTTASIVENFANQSVAGVMQQVTVPHIGQVVSTLQDPKVPKSNKAWLVAGGVLGGTVGYQLAGKGKRLSGVIISGVGGMILTQVVSNIFFLQKEEALKQQSLADSAEKIYSAMELVNLPLSKFIPASDMVLNHLIGDEMNEKFSLLLFGEAGGGKSHLATKLAGELGQFGKVLYVLAEEEITNSVQQRTARYDCENVTFFVNRNAEQILEQAKSYDFLVLDSLNGILNYSLHTDFLRKVKAGHLRGSILLNQVNKAGQFVGQNAILHEVDAEIIVNDGTAKVGKNRFGKTEGKEYSIFQTLSFGRKTV